MTPPSRTGAPREAPPQSAQGEGECPNSRRATRYQVNLEVDLSSEHNFYSGFVENMSVGGVFIATHKSRPVGTRLELSLSLPDEHPPLRVTGEVRWLRTYSESSHAPPGLGVRFLHVDAEGAVRVERFLAQRQPLFHDDD